MKIVFFVYHGGFVRNFEPVLRALASAGHEIQIRVDVVRRPFELTLANRLASDFPGVSVGRTPLARVPTTWTRLAMAVRQTQDYLRYLHPDWAEAHGLRARAREQAPSAAARAVDRIAALGPRWVSRVSRLLAAVERIVPTVPEIDAFLHRERPDLVVVTPLVDFGSLQVDYLKSADRLGIRTALWVASWDNLTNKGLMRVQPGRVFVWNHAQQQEAANYHGVDPSRIVVTGAQIFDHWFGRRPVRTREAFCARVGLDPSRPFLLYLGSSTQIAPDEVGFATSWVRLVRAAADPALAGAGLLFRPHPGRVTEWSSLDMARLPGVAVWPKRADTTAFDPDFNDDYFESMYYAAAVVGVNTSGMIESAILGKPVMTWRAAEFEPAQQGTRHFQHLVGGEHALLHVADTAEEHLSGLARALASAGTSDARSAAFVESFVRPFGRDVVATDRFTAALQAWLAEPPPPPRSNQPSRLARAIVRVLAPFLVMAASEYSLGESMLRGAVTVMVRVATLGYRIADLLDWRTLGTRTVSTAGKWVDRTRRDAGRWFREAFRSLRRSVRMGLHETGRGFERGQRRLVRSAREWRKSGGRRVARAGKGFRQAMAVVRRGAAYVMRRAGLR